MTTGIFAPARQHSSERERWRTASSLPGLQHELIRISRSGRCTSTESYDPRNPSYTIGATSPARGLNPISALYGPLSTPDPVTGVTAQYSNCVRPARGRGRRQHRGMTDPILPAVSGLDRHGEQAVQQTSGSSNRIGDRGRPKTRATHRLALLGSSRAFELTTAQHAGDAISSSLNGSYALPGWGFTRARELQRQGTCEPAVTINGTGTSSAGSVSRDFARDDHVSGRTQRAPRKRTSCLDLGCRRRVRFSGGALPREAMPTRSTCSTPRRSGRTRANNSSSQNSRCDQIIPRRVVRLGAQFTF
jgi:hypothetical protein